MLKNGALLYLARPGRGLISQCPHFLNSLDPFAGSNITGRAAETLKRKWLAMEIVKDYRDGSRYRFDYTHTDEGL